MVEFLKTLKVPLTLLIAFFLLFFVSIKLFGPIPFAVDSIQTTKTNTFQVSGVGKASDVPDSASVSFGVTKNATTIADAQNQTNTLITTITDALKKEGIEEKNIKTTNYNVNPNYDFTSGRQTITGYTVTQTIDLTIQPIDKVNKVLDILTTNGANIVNQVNFTFSDAKKKALENKAREMAVKEAKDKAQGLSQAAGIHLGRIIDVTEETAQEPRPIMPMVAQEKGLGAAGAPSQVTPGENSISLTVTLSYETY